MRHSSFFSLGIILAAVFAWASPASAATAITSYLEVNGTWQQASSATVAAGSTVNLGPQPLSGGSWLWSGPSGFSSSAREIDAIKLSTGSNVYTATYTDSTGAKSSLAFTITVSAASSTCAATAIAPYLYANGGWSQATSATVSSTTATVDIGPQPLSGGSWSWSGPNGFTSTAREIDSIKLSAGANVYTATYTNTCGAKSTLAFTITAPSSTCTPTAISPYLYANGAWSQATSATVSSTTATVDIGPQPLSGGSWSWSGPNGYSSTAREIDSIPLVVGTDTYTATYTNSCGAKSTLAFTITVSGPSVPSGKYVTLRANALAEVIRTDSSSNLIADQTSWSGSSNEEFVEVSNSDGTVSFYSIAAQKYVSAHSTTQQLVADSTSIGSQQKFQILASQLTGWSNTGTDSVILSTALNTDWAINSSTNGAIYAASRDDAGSWQNMSIMPIPVLPGGSNINYPQSGADVSEGLGAQNAGVVFEDTNGVAGDYLKILSNHGVKWARCRINVNPAATSNYGVLQTTQYVAQVLAAAKADGFKLLLDFQFSDTWADPSAQTTPAAWSTTNLGTLENQLQAYVTSVLGTLSSDNAWPDMIQIGNEVDSGMLWPLGNAWVSGVWGSNYPVLYNTAYNAVSSASSQLSKPMPKIMLHLSSSGNLGNTRNFLDSALGSGMKFDVVGLSYYEMWDGPVANMKATIDEIYYRYPSVKIAIAETAYYYTANVLSPTDPLTYPTTPAGQTQFLTDVMTQAGYNPNLNYVFYWGTYWDKPASWYSPWPDSSGSAQDTANRGLFDATGKLLPAISVLTTY